MTDDEQSARLAVYALADNEAKYRKCQFPRPLRDAIWRWANGEEDHQPNEKHIARVAMRLAEQIKDYHDPEWDYGDPDSRRLIWRAARRIAEAEDREIAVILGNHVRA